MSARTPSGSGYSRTSGLPSTTSFTACGWARLQTDANNYGWIFSLATTGAGSYCLIGVDVTGTNLVIANSGGGGLSSTIAALTLGQWFFWAVTCSGTGASSMTGYYAPVGALNFVTQTFNGSSFTPNNMYLGYTDWAENIDVDLQQVRVWDVALTAQELYAEASSMAVPAKWDSLHLWSPMDSALDYTDHSGNARSWGIATGTPTTEEDIIYTPKKRRRYRKLADVVAAPPAAPFPPWPQTIYQRAP